MNTEQQINELIFTELKSHTNLSEMVFQALRNAIINGNIKPGERLLQINLAHQMGVSQRTVREALAKLEAKGLVLHEPYKGVRVIALPLEEIKEIYALRSILESHAIDLAFYKLDNRDFIEMENLLPLTSVGVNPNDIFSAQEANRKFHWVVIKKSNSSILINLLEHIWELMYTYQLIYTEIPEIQNTRIINDLEQHKEFLEALKSNQIEKAKEINIRHIQTTIEKLIEGFQKENKEIINIT